MTDQPKTPGAMVIVPSDELHRIADRMKFNCPNLAVELEQIVAASVEQTPAVGGDIPRYWVHWNDQLLVKTPDVDEDTVCKWPDVAPLVADRDKWAHSWERSVAYGARLEREADALLARIAELEAQLANKNN